MELRFFVCEHCGNMVEMVKSSGVPMMCCGQKMTEIIPGTVDAAREKHVPVYEVNGNAVLVRIGAVEHPMQDVHYIEWIALQPGEKPEASFALCEGDEVVAAYAYCNLHGLWKA